MNLKQIVNSNNRLSEIVRFGLVGGLATVLQYGIYVVFVHVVGVRAVPSTMISYGISFIFNYILSSYFTFHKHPTTRNGLGFALSHLVNMGLQTGLVAIFKEIVGPTLALLPAMGICIPANYLMVRFAFTSKYFQSKGERTKTVAEQDTK
ncbi:MAG: GtrA family protein [Muribaculaceae bacterium]|nr:GtrA family protein [Muribaculaceae bacterium]